MKTKFAIKTFPNRTTKVFRLQIDAEFDPAMSDYAVEEALQEAAISEGRKHLTPAERKADNFFIKAEDLGAAVIGRYTANKFHAEHARASQWFTVTVIVYEA